MNFKNLIPTKFNQFLSLLSFIGFIAIFLEFIFGMTWISDNLTDLFLIMGGLGFLVVGKVLTIHSWAMDGFQKNEVIQLVAVVIGGASTLLGMMLLFGLAIPENLTGLVGVLALIPALYILADYLYSAK